MTTPNLSVAALDQAVDTILQNNFDADTKACLITLMKVLDNVIQKPFDAKVRSIRLGNAAFSKKVASRKGGVEFLLACGFVRETPPPPLLSKGAEPLEEFLVLKDDDDSLMDDQERQAKKEAYTKHIVTARRLLLTRAVKDLHLKAEELPAYKPPPPPVASNANFTSQGDPSATFDPFATQRYDGMSAAVGAQLTPDGTYESTTEKQLKTLQQKQKKLEQKMQTDLRDREWVASHPNSSGKPTAILQSSNDTGSGKGDAGLIGAQFARQQAAKKQREDGGFTTKSMRELEKLKKQKVYSHTQLALQFSDGTTLQGKFLPKENVGRVMEAMKECFLVAPTGPMELYITPPRKTLPSKSKLQDEGLVPAAKVFVKVQLPDQRPFLKPEIFQASPVSAFPSSQAVVSQKDDSKPAARPAKAAKPAASAEDKEEEMMRRMMGGGRRLGGGGANSGSGGGGSKKPGSGKPKWFK